LLSYLLHSRKIVSTLYSKQREETFLLPHMFMIFLIF
jgi:hypothetical protein